MPVDAASRVEAFVIVDGRRLIELEDSDAAPRSWEWLGAGLKEQQGRTERDAACQSVRACAPGRRHKCLLATSAGTEFQLGVVNKSNGCVAIESFVDGQQIDCLTLFGAGTADVLNGLRWSSSAIEGDYFAGSSMQCNTVRKMKFANIVSETSETDGSEGQAGRIDIVVRPFLSIDNDNDPYLLSGAVQGASSAGGAATTSKKKVFALEAAFGAAEAVSTGGSLRNDEIDYGTVLATFSFRYAAIEALQIDKTNPKAWLSMQTSEIEAARQRSRDLRAALRAGYAISEPPSYLFNHKLSSLAGSGAPRALSDAAALDKALRGDGFKLCGEARSLFEALSHQLCGTHALARYVEHVVLEELEQCDRERYGATPPVTFEEELGDLFKPTRSPLKDIKAWRSHLRLRAKASGGTVCEGQRYDDAAALADEPPPLEPGDLVLVAPEDGVGDAYEASVQPGGDAIHVVVKELGKAPEAIRRSSPRLNGGGIKNRRGGYVALMQHAILQQAFCNAFGVRLFVTLLTRARKSTQLRVVRVEPRAGRRVLINGYGIAHLGGNSFDSIERHHDVIEIASDDESADDDDVKPDPEPPAAPPRKKARTSSPRVKKEKA